ncbi:MAG TPA: hypothetical protein VK507_19265 [Iamia sp.]|nr:hypothetical protein [Iamia sp.]
MSEDRSTTGTRRRGARGALGAGLVVVLAVVAGAIVAGSGGEQARDDAPPPPTMISTTPTEPAPSTTTAPPTTGTEEDPAGVPLEPRVGVATTWTGSEVVIWGGEATEAGPEGDGGAALDDGAAFDPDAGAWRTMAPSPLPPAPTDPRPVAASTAGRVVVARGPDVAVWDPATDTWEELTDAPVPVLDLTAVADGVVASVSANARLDLATGAWAPFAAAPVTFTRPTTPAWTGTEIVVIGANLSAFVLDPATGAWAEPVPAPDDALNPAALASAWDGERVVVTDYDMGAAAFDPAARAWTVLPDVPARFYEHYPSSVAAGGLLVTVMALAVVVWNDDGWVPLPFDALPGGPPVVIDAAPPGRIAWWDVTHSDVPPQVTVTSLTDLLATPRRQVGVGTITLGPGDEQENATSARSSSPVGPPALAVDLVVRVAEGGTCTVTSTYGGALGSDEQRAVPETIEGGHGSTHWFHDPAGRRWEAEASDSDVFTVACDDPGAARRLVETVDFGPIR